MSETSQRINPISNLRQTRTAGIVPAKLEPAYGGWCPITPQACALHSCWLLSMSSSSTSTRRALKGLEDGLQAFTTQLSHETAELRRNIDNQPTTGPTFYSRILADVFERLEGVGQDLAVLEGVSLDAVSLEVRPPPITRQLPPAATLPHHVATCSAPCRRSWWVTVWPYTARTISRSRSWRRRWRSTATGSCTRRCRPRRHWICLSWGKWRQVGDRAAGCSSQRGCVQAMRGVGMYGSFLVSLSSC